jgi:hypothetical protein
MINLLNYVNSVQSVNPGVRLPLLFFYSDHPVNPGYPDNTLFIFYPEHPFILDILIDQCLKCRVPVKIIDIP